MGCCRVPISLAIPSIPLAAAAAIKTLASTWSGTCPSRRDDNDVRLAAATMKLSSLSSHNYSGFSDLFPIHRIQEQLKLLSTTPRSTRLKMPAPNGNLAQVPDDRLRLHVDQSLYFDYDRDSYVAWPTVPVRTHHVPRVPI